MFEIGDYVKCVDDHTTRKITLIRLGNIYQVLDIFDSTIGLTIRIDNTHFLWSVARFVFVSKTVPDDPYTLDIIDV